jgi:hypothetical protein
VSHASGHNHPGAGANVAGPAWLGVGPVEGPAVRVLSCCGCPSTHWSPLLDRHLGHRSCSFSAHPVFGWRSCWRPVHGPVVKRRSCGPWALSTPLDVGANRQIPVGAPGHEMPPATDTPAHPQVRAGRLRHGSPRRRCAAHRHLRPIENSYATSSQRRLCLGRPVYLPLLCLVRPPGSCQSPT